MGCSFLLILPYFSLVSHLFEMTISVEQIAQALDLDLEQVRQAIQETP